MVEELLFGKATTKHCKLAAQNNDISDMTSTTTTASSVRTTSSTRNATTSSTAISVDCSSLDVAAVKRFSRDVHGYSYTFKKWDPIYKFGNMPEPRMMHRFGM